MLNCLQIIDKKIDYQNVYLLVILSNLHNLWTLYYTFAKNSRYNFFFFSNHFLGFMIPKGTHFDSFSKKAFVCRVS